MWLLLARPLAAAVLFVDPNGADGNPGTQAQPLRSVGAAVARTQGGDVVVVRPGVYRESVVLDRAGAPGSEIVLRGLPGAILESPDPAQSVSAFDVDGSAAHVVIEGFELRGGFAETVFLRSGAHDIELAGLYVHDNRTGVWIGGARDVTVRDCVIEHNHRTGVRIFAGARRVHVLDTRAEANDDGLGCQGDSDGVNADASTADVILERVTAAGNSEDGFDLQTPSATVLQSVARDNGCSGVKLAAGGYVENVLVERNATGVNISGTAGQITIVQSSTLLDNALGLRAIGGGYTVQLLDSIVAGPGKALSYAATVALTEAFNLLYRPLAKDRLIVRVDGVDELRYSGNDVNDGRWHAESGQGQGTLYGEPRLAPDSCEPLEDSPAVDSGGGRTMPGVDLVGTFRPAGLGIDRGAVERVPAPPTLRILRSVARPAPDGAGRVSLHLEVRLPSGVRFDAATEPLIVAARGARGEAVRVDTPPPASAAAHRTSRSRLRFVNDGARVRLWLTAEPAQLWTVDGGQIALTVALGRMRVTAAGTLRSGR
jgi:hypothetical protein